jgi:hypothetical protein
MARQQDQSYRSGVGAGRSEESGSVEPILARWRIAPPLERRVGIPDQYSLFIHFWRIVATASVFIGHATRPDILFDIDLSLVGRATIPTFLMISGYFTTMSFSNGGRFLKKIAKRYCILYVFFVPASVLVLLMDFYMVGSGAPILLKDKFDPDLSLLRIAADSFNLLTFSGEYWRPGTFGQGVFSNEAIWTIDYIMGFTLLSGGIFLLAGWRRVVAILIISALIGPKVLLLAPLWFAGALAYRLQRQITGRWRLEGIARGCIVLAVVSWISIEFMDVGEQLYQWSKSFAPYEIRQYLGMSKRFLWQWSYIPSLFLLLLFSRVLLDGPVSATVMKAVSTVSKYALPIYAIHFSLMYFVQAFIPDYIPRHDSSDPYIMMGTTLLLAIAFGYGCFTWIKPATDRWAARIFG